MKTDSKLEKFLVEGKFVVIGECFPPEGADINIIKKKSSFLKENVDVVNVPDNPGAIVRMSSISTASILTQMGFETIVHMTTRDRNRIALQSDILGAYSLGIKNILCISGEHQRLGNHPQSKNVFDIDSIQLIQTVKEMRDNGKFLSQDDIKGIPKMFIGATENPFADPFEFRVIRLLKKVKAGAEFIQTRSIYNINKFKKWIQEIVLREIDKKVYIIAGVTPLKSLEMIQYMKDHVSGIDIPDEIIERMKSVPKDKQQQEGIAICVETIKELKELNGIHGIHIMTMGWEESVPFIVKESNLLSNLRR